ncbi:helix-turn-helix domain-containing protein [Streptomyces globisporus]|uniref:helix-turn-helix domain-containing protein n=1 Tax=Streptomyces globisporus TaxID=1908 RepID=UPI00099B565F|nr:helix-turn-helix transcriptional regulator [Streptomyces globisporus]
MSPPGQRHASRTREHRLGRLRGASRAHRQTTRVLLEVLTDLNTESVRTEPYTAEDPGRQGQVRGASASEISNSGAFEDLCGSCGRDVSRAQPAFPSVPPLVWDRQDVRQALAQRDFGRLCRLVREYGGLRQEDMATLTGLSQSFLSLLESGRRRLTHIERIIVLLDGLDTPADMTGPMLRPLPEEQRPPLREVC